MEDPRFRLLEALDFRDRYVVERGSDAHDVDLPLLDLLAAIRDDGQPVAGLGQLAEDVIELYCHGGPLSARSILNVLLQNGARAASTKYFRLPTRMPTP